MAPLSYSVFLAIALTLCIVGVHSVDYYWRDFHGSIPSDAIPAGLDQNKQPLYVGQAFGNYKGMWALSPVGLSEGKKDYVVSFNSAFLPSYTNETYALKVYLTGLEAMFCPVLSLLRLLHSSGVFKSPQTNSFVLCSTNKDNLKWVSTSSYNFSSVENVVQGGWGHESGTVTPLYVGRCLRFGYSALGRIQTAFDNFNNNIRYMHEGSQYYSGTFDVLTYQE